MKSGFRLILPCMHVSRTTFTFFSRSPGGPFAHWSFQLSSQCLYILSWSFCKASIQQIERARQRYRRGCHDMNLHLPDHTVKWHAESLFLEFDRHLNQLETYDVSLYTPNKALPCSKNRFVLMISTFVKIQELYRHNCPNYKLHGGLIFKRTVLWHCEDCLVLFLPDFSRHRSILVELCKSWL